MSDGRALDGAAPAPTTHRRRPVSRWLRWSPVAAVVVALLAVSWQRRWMSDDGFINLRVVRQLGAGNGPVFNDGERVEVATSPLWLYLLAAGRLVTRARHEWVAVLGGLATTAGAVVVAAAGATRLHRIRGPLLPLGLVVFVAPSIVWDYTTGGLENGLSWLWWAATFALVVRATVGEERTGPLAAAFVTGLAPLVRPDLVLPGAIFGAWLAWRVLRDPVATPGERPAAEPGEEPGRGPGEQPDGRGERPEDGSVEQPATESGTGSAGVRVRRGVRLVVVAGALPGAYQLFRMGYYGQVLPNTVYAKEGGLAWWDRGLRYVGDLVVSYWLWVPLLACGAVLVALAASGLRRVPGWLPAVVVSVVAALAHAALVARAGGDYMFGRLLLPALFGLVLPVAVVPVPARVGRRAVLAVGGGAVALAAGWALVTAVWVRPVDHPAWIGDERAGVVAETGVAHPVGVEAHVAYLEGRGVDLVGFDRGEPALALGPDGPRLGPLAPGEPHVVIFGAMGAVPFRLPVEVRVADALGLADPVVAHVRLEHRGEVPGHEKYLRTIWWAARVLPDDVAFPPSYDQPLILVVDPPPPRSADPAVVAEQRRRIVAALGCGRLADLRAAYTQPLTPGRFVRNVVRAPLLHGFRFSRVPEVAQHELCGP